MSILLSLTSVLIIQIFMHWHRLASEYTSTWTHCVKYNSYSSAGARCLPRYAFLPPQALVWPGEPARGDGGDVQEEAGGPGRPAQTSAPPGRAQHCVHAAHVRAGGGASQGQRCPQSAGHLQETGKLCFCLFLCWDIQEMRNTFWLVHVFGNPFHLFIYLFKIEHSGWLYALWLAGSWASHQALSRGHESWEVAVWVQEPSRQVRRTAEGEGSESESIFEKLKINSFYMGGNVHMVYRVFLYTEALSFPSWSSNSFDFSDDKWCLDWRLLWSLQKALPYMENCVLVDTVLFFSGLPHPVSILVASAVKEWLIFSLTCGCN